MSRAINKQIKRDNLLSQGLLLLMEKGYHGTGLTEILNAVKVPKGSFYSYFGSKESYCAEVIQHYIEPFIQQLTGYLQENEQNALLALQTYFEALIVELENADFKGGCLLGNLMGEIGDTSDLCQQSLKNAVNRYRNLVQQAVAMAQEQGSVRKDLTAREIADLLVNTWQGVLLRMKIEKSVVPLRQFCDALLGDFIKA